MNCTPLCVNQDEKFIQVKLTPLRSIFKYGYTVNLIFLYKQTGDLLSIHSNWGRFDIYNYRSDIYNMLFNFLCSFLPNFSPNPQTTLSAHVGQQFDKWQWVIQKPNIHIEMADSKPINEHVVTKYLGKYMAYAKYWNHVVWHMQNKCFWNICDWSQPKTKENFLKDKDLTNKTQRLLWLRVYFKC